ncbi:hypothetical protein F0562_022622 [Nyssa sinensis]|uniref:Uncharacterized protein n=1 Tax=Nyssa sinensis TaxID=561372 RepID=A0A5J5BS81_9ASTE|nr:hypothetical protein F0562_022622 [Nyssa sinensis]
MPRLMACKLRKQHKSQGISAATSFNGSHLNKYHHAHGVSDSHAQGATTASSGEFIPKEALDLEEEYGGFSVNSEFLFGQDNHFPEVSINGGYNTGGFETGPRGTGPLVNPPQILLATDGQEDNLAGVSILVGQTIEGADPNLCAAHGKAKGHAALPTDHTDYTATVTSKFNTLASSSSVGNTVPSQHERLISPSAGVACPSIIVGCSDTAHPPTPNVAIQAQAPYNVDQVQPLQPALALQPTSCYPHTHPYAWKSDHSATQYEVRIKHCTNSAY